MAADVLLDSNPSNPCCAELAEKYLKVKSQKSDLIKGFKEIKVKFERLVEDNLQLKKANEELQRRGKQEKSEEVDFSMRQKLEREIHDLQGQISSYQKNQCLINVNKDEMQLLKARILEREDEIKGLKDLLEKEKKKSDSEMKKAESEKKKAAEAWKMVKMEKNKVEEGRKHVEIERKKTEDYKLCLEKAKSEAKEVKAKLSTELSKVDNARKRVEEAKQKANMEKARADSLVIKADEQKRLMEAEKKRANDEKVRADRLSQMLEEEKQRREEMQKKMEENVPNPAGRCDSCNGEEKHNGNASIMNANMKVLREQLKLEKKKAKYAKRMAQLEKAEKSYIMKELHILKRSFMQILSRFNTLDDWLAHSIEGTDAVPKTEKPSEVHGIILQNNLLGSNRDKDCSRIDCGIKETCCTGSFNYTDPTREFVGLPLARGGCTRPTTGIISELESPTGGSDRNKSQCSYTSYSDKRSMGSQERGSFAVTTSAKLTKKRSNKGPTITELSSEMTKSGKIKGLGVMANTVDETYGQREAGNACLSASMHGELEVMDGEFDSRSKRRKVHHTMDPVVSVSNHCKIGGKLSGFKDILNVAGGMTAVNCSQGDDISQKFHNEIGCFAEENNESCRRKINQSSNTRASEQQLPVLQTFCQNDKKQCGNFEGQRSRDPNVAEVPLSSHALTGNSYIEQDGNVLSNERADFISFENMIHGNCLKLLDLDNDADEERYKMAVQMPLSPTLPDIELPNHQLCGENNAQYVMEIDKPVSFQPVDVMSTEVGVSIAALDLPSCKVQDSLHLTNDPGKTCAIKLQTGVSQHGRLDSVEDGPSLSCNHGPQDGEQMCTYGNSGDNDTIMLPFLVKDDTFPNPNTSRKSVSDVIDKLLLSSHISGSYSLHDDGCLQSSNGMIDNFISNASPAVNIQNKAIGCFGTRNPGLVENQIDGKEGAPGGTIFYSSKNQLLTAEINKCTKSNKDIFNSDIAKQGSIHQLSEASRQTVLSTSCNVEDSSRTIPNDEVGRTPVHCVLFSNNKDKASISRILHCRNSFSCQSFMVSQIDHVVVQAHSALAMDAVLLPEEKGSVFFSLLLCNISSRMSANFKGTMSEHLLPCVTSFAAEINKVLSDAETKSLFKEICQLDVLSSLAEDFLIERKLIVCGDRLNECNDSSSKLFHWNGAYVCSRVATVDHFVAGCVILASISAAAERIGFLLESSYRILRTSRNDVSWILLALHVFASVCGKEFLNVEEYGFLIIAFRSVVLSLERGEQSVSSMSSFVCPVSEGDSSIPPSSECPFATGAVCMDKLINLLLDVLRYYILTGDGHPYVNNAVNFSVYFVQSCTQRDEEGRGNKSELDGQTKASLASCCLFRFQKHAADLPEHFPEKAFCHFNDIVSLVELVGCYMSWEWTYNNIIPHLTKMLESCKIEEFSAALFILIGQLGSFGIAAGGPQAKGIAELICNISMLLDTSMERKISFPTQLAAIGSLLNLLPLSIRDIIGQYEELALDTTQSIHAKLIREWFSKLTKQQQSLSLNCFDKIIIKKVM